jgi:hypothetical protein
MRSKFSVKHANFSFDAGLELWFKISSSQFVMVSIPNLTSKSFNNINFAAVGLLTSRAEKLSVWAVSLWKSPCSNAGKTIQQAQAGGH